MTQPRKGARHKIVIQTRIEIGGGKILVEEREALADVPELAILLRDAEPRADELNDAKCLRARDIARDELIRMYSEAEKAGTLATLDPRVRRVCDELKKINGGTLPPRKGGRPRDNHRRLLVCRKVQTRINAGEGVVEAMKQVAAAEKPPMTYEAVRTIWYGPSPEWQRLVKADKSLWAYETGEIPQQADMPGRKRRNDSEKA